MNKPTSLGVLGIAIIAGAAAAVFGFYADLRDTPATLSGANLAVVAGLVPDPHLLTNRLWPAITNGPWPFRSSIVNVASFALCVAFFAFIAGRLRGTLAALVSGAFLASSPFAIALLIDPLGGETLVALALFIALEADVAGALRTGWLVRAILPAAIVLQEPLFGAGAIAYGVLQLYAGRSALAKFTPLAAALLAVLGRVILTGSALHIPQIDAMAAGRTTLITGLLIFLIAPAVLFGIKKGLHRKLGLYRGRFGLLALMGAAALVPTVFSWTGDPSIGMLAAQATFALALLAASYVPRSTGFATVATLLACMSLVNATLATHYRKDFPAIQTAERSRDLLQALRNARLSDTVCILTNPAAENHILAKGAFLTRYAPSGRIHTSARLSECRHARGNYLISVSDDAITNWGRPGLTLASAMREEDHAQIVLTDNPGDVFPKTRVNLPGGYGAFGNLEPSPLGRLTTMTVVTGFSYRYPCVQIAAGNRLAFFAANPIHNGEPALLRVTYRTAGAAHLLFTGYFRGTPPGVPTDWRAYRVDVPSGNCTTLTFSVSTPSGQTTGAWVTFVAMVSRR